MSVVLKFILVMFITIGLYCLVEKYARKNNKDLFNYRMLCRNICIFFNGYYIKMKVRTIYVK